MKVLVLGKNGQLSSEIFDIVHHTTLKNDYIFAGSADFDLSKIDNINQKLSEYNPDIIINTAAYTAVDLAEDDKENCALINHHAVEKIAEWTTENQKKLIHISTDYVFDGTKKEAYQEEDNTQPINWYGATKRAGEKAILANNTDAIIVRTSWVYSTYGNNFVKTMLRLMNEREQLNIVADQFGSPTYAKDLAEILIKIIEDNIWKNGIYHFSNEGKISWFDFATAIKNIANIDCKLTPITTDLYPTKAQRPQNSLLDKSKIKDTFNIQICDWQLSLEKMLQKLQQSDK